MNIVLTHHAQEKILERAIPDSLIPIVLSQPDLVRPARNGAEEAYKKFDAIFLKIVFLRRATSFLIITIYWIEKIRNS